MNFRARARRVQAGDNLIALLREALGLRAQAHLDAFALQNIQNRGGYIFILGETSAGLFSMMVTGAETPEHLAELQSNITATR